MRRILLGIGGVVGLLVAAFAGFVGFQSWKVAHPKVEHPPLPEGLIALASPEGQALLASAGGADVDALTKAFTPQQQQHWAGVAATATVLTASGHPLEQTAFFTPGTDAVRPWWKIKFSGMTLDDLGGMFEAHGATADVHHADDGLAAFRAAARQNLATPGDFLVVNYHRSVLNQGASGNIAPVAAWDAASDRMLVLDAATFKWPAVWIRTDDLFAAMDTVDGEVGKKRGWIEVRPR